MKLKCYVKIDIDLKYVKRLWTQYAADDSRQNVLHAVRNNRHTTVSHHVPVGRRAVESLRVVLHTASEKVLAVQKDRSQSDRDGLRGGHFRRFCHHWRRCHVLALRGLDLFQLHLLLRHYVNYYRIR